MSKQRVSDELASTDAAGRKRPVECVPPGPALPGLRAYAKDLLDSRAEVERLRTIFNEDNAACLCGCTLDEHEGHGEDGEFCEHEDHVCIRVSVAAAEVHAKLRARVEELERREQRILVELYRGMEGVNERPDPETVIRITGEYITQLLDDLAAARARLALVERQRGMTHAMLLRLVDALDDPGIASNPQIATAMQNAKAFMRDPDAALRAAQPDEGRET